MPQGGNSPNPSGMNNSIQPPPFRRELLSPGRKARLAFNTKDTCGLLGGISIRSLRRLELGGHICCSKALGRKLFPLSEIERFLNNTLALEVVQ